MIVAPDVVIPKQLHARLLNAVLASYPRKCFGLLASGGHRYTPTDFFMFSENVRNASIWQESFHARGQYFVDHDDAGFVASPEESWQAHKYISQSGVQEVAVFHTHRRHPGNFSSVDYELHLSRFQHVWHLVISLRNKDMPQLRAFDVKVNEVRELRVLIE